MRNKKYFYEQMGYELEENLETPSIKRNDNKDAFVAQMNIKSDSEAFLIRPELKDDFVEVRRADLEPVLYAEYDLNELIFTIIKTLQNVSRNKFYGVTILVDVLKGVNNKKIFENQLHLVTEFGALKEMPHETIVAVIDWMISEHLILKTKGKYPVLHSTYEGLHYSEKVTALKLKRLKKYLEEEVILWNQ